MYSESYLILVVFSIDYSVKIDVDKSKLTAHVCEEKIISALFYGIDMCQ